MAYSHAPTNAKLRYKTTNWKQYNQALINRGSLTLWIDEISANIYLNSIQPNKIQSPHFSDGG